MHDHRYHGTPDRLRSSKRIALLEIKRVIDLSLAGLTAKNILDVGTGTGLFAEAFIAQNLEVFGIDPNPQMLRTARQSLPQAWFQLDL
jgi:2-polyprenyl-3-methyl-5-hydroxy-6-metoxy-1,4-benzoquinol methylase